jgi:hypothetical protein
MSLLDKRNVRVVHSMSAAVHQKLQNSEPMCPPELSRKRPWKDFLCALPNEPVKPVRPTSGHPHEVVKAPQNYAAAVPDSGPPAQPVEQRKASQQRASSSHLSPPHLVPQPTVVSPTRYVRPQDSSLHSKLGLVFSRLLDRYNSSGCTELGADAEHDDLVAREESAALDLRTRIASALESEQQQTDESPQRVNVRKRRVSFLRSLLKRVERATLLRRVQRHEERTLEMAVLAGKIEVVALTDVLRDIMGAVLRGESWLDHTTPANIEYVSQYDFLSEVQGILYDEPASKQC